MNRKAKKTTRVRWVITVISAVILTTGLAYALTTPRSPVSLDEFREKLRTPRFQLHMVEFLGLETIDSGELLGLVDLSEGVPLIDLDLADIRERIGSHPRIAECMAARIFPNRLLIGVDERKPVAQLKATGKGIDLEGQTFSLIKGESESLTTITGNVDWALQLIETAREMNVEITWIDARSAEDLRFRPVDREITIRIGIDARRALEDWLQLREGGLLKGYAAQEIDLRFPGSTVLRRFKDLKGGREDGST